MTSEASVSIYLQIVLLAAGAFVLNGIAMARGIECERGTISVVVSPDNARVALVREGVLQRRRVCNCIDRYRADSCGATYINRHNQISTPP